MNNTDRNGNPMDERPRIERHTRADRPRATAERRSKANDEGSDEVPAPRPRREHRETKFVPRVAPPPVAPPAASTAEVAPSESPSEERSVKGEREARRGKKGPSLAYYNPNPAERLKQRTRPSGEAPASERRKEISGEKRLRQERPPKSTKPRTKKDPAKQLPKKEDKPEEAGKVEAKPKEVPVPPKKVEKRETEHDRLLRMTKSGVDLTRMGIYAVEGKDLEETQSQVRNNLYFLRTLNLN